MWPALRVLRALLFDGRPPAGTVDAVHKPLTRVVLSFLGAFLLAGPVVAAAGHASAAEPGPAGVTAEPLNALQNGTVQDLRGMPPIAAWPLPDSSLWVPPRQGSIVFGAPVDASTFALTLNVPNVAPVQLSRLTKGESRSVVFAFPVLEGPAELALSYSGLDQDGRPLAGSIAFSLEKPFVTSGGGNHRHASDTVHEDQPELVLLRAMLVWSAALAMLSAWRTRRGRRAFSELILPRVAGLLLAVAALWQAGLLLAGQLEQYPDTPFLAVMASAGLWLFLPLAGAGLLQVVAGRRDDAMAVVSLVALLSVVASTSHSSGVWGALQSVVYAVLLFTAAALGAALVELGSRLWSSTAGSTAYSVALRVLVLSVSVTVLSLAMVFLHAHGLSLNGDFAQDVMRRLITSLVLLASAGVSVLVSLRAGSVIARVAAPPLVIAAGVAMTYLLWLPPPTSGL